MTLAIGQIEGSVHGNRSLRNLHDVDGDVVFDESQLFEIFGFLQRGPRPSRKLLKHMPTKAVYPDVKPPGTTMGDWCP